MFDCYPLCLNMDKIVIEDEQSWNVECLLVIPQLKPSNGKTA